MKNESPDIYTRLEILIEVNDVISNCYIHLLFDIKLHMVQVESIQ